MATKTYTVLTLAASFTDSTGNYSHASKDEVVELTDSEATRLLNLGAVEPVKAKTKTKAA